MRSIVSQLQSPDVSSFLQYFGLFPLNQGTHTRFECVYLRVLRLLGGIPKTRARVILLEFHTIDSTKCRVGTLVALGLYESMTVSCRDPS